MPLPDRAVHADGGGEAAWVEARRLYEQTRTPVRDIADRLGGLTPRALYRIAHRRGWKRHGWPRRLEMREEAQTMGTAGAPASGPGPRQSARSQNFGRPASGRQALIRKLERTVAREIAAIDARVRKNAGDATRDAQGIDHERHAKALATLARTLRELAAIDRAETLEREAQLTDRAAPGEDDDDAFPRDAEILRETLARRLEQLCRDRAAR